VLETQVSLHTRTHREVRRSLRLSGHPKVCEQVKGPAHSRLGQGGQAAWHSPVRISDSIDVKLDSMQRSYPRNDQASQCLCQEWQKTWETQEDRRDS